MPKKAVGMAAPASEAVELDSEPELEPEPEPEPLEEEEPELDLVVLEERPVLRLELELPAAVPLLVPMMVPLGAMEAVPLLSMVPVPMTPGAVVMGEELVALLMMPALAALLTRDEAAAVREETPAESVG